MTDHSTDSDRTPRSIAAVDMSVLDAPALTVSDLLADAAGITAPVTANTVGELFTAQADAVAAAATAALADAAAPVALVQGAAALVDAAGTLRFLADHSSAAHDNPTRARWQQLAAELTREAGALMLTRDQQASRRAGDGQPAA